MINTLKKQLFQDRGIVENNIHLAIIDQPFLDLIICGKKKIETRFTTTNREPFKKVYTGDIVFFKEPSKPISGYFTVKKVCYYFNENNILTEIKDKYSNDICSFADSEFWEKRKNKKYISLIWIDEIKLIEHFEIAKKDRRGWVSFEKSNYSNVLLISGKIGSGKSYWAKKIMEYHNFDYTSFSTYIKYLCQKEGRKINRKNLQEIGENAVNCDIDKFIYFIFNCSIEKKSNTLIIDGLRHKKVFEKIKNIYHNTKIIFVNCSEEIRKKRIEERGDLFYNEIDQHSTELEYEEIRKLSSYEIDNNSCNNKILLELQDIALFFME
jgi:cytidylate kinase/ASC-1-like (ASCH) protein